MWYAIVRLPARTDTTTATALGTVALNGSGQASFTTSALAGGNHTIPADYVGAGNLDPASDTTNEHVVSGSTPSTQLT